MNTIRNFQVPLNAVKFCVAEQLLTFQDGLSSTELVSQLGSEIIIW